MDKIISTFENLLESLEDLYFGLKAEQALDEGEYIDFDEANKRPLFSKARIRIRS